MKTILILILLLCIGVAPVFACTQAPTPVATPVNTPVPFPMAEHYTEEAPIIFVGMALEAIWTDNYSVIFEIQVQRYLKGDGYELVQIGTYLRTTCGLGISVGEQYVFFVEEAEYTQGIPLHPPITHYAIEAESIVSALTGQSTAPQPLPLDIQISRIAENGDLNWVYIPLSVLAATVGLIAIPISLRLRNRRKSKAKREELI